MLKYYSKQFDVQITEAGKTVKKTFEVDKSVKTIYGVCILSNRDDLAYYRGSFRLEINKDEIYADGYSTKKIMSSENVEPNKRCFYIGKIIVGNGLITFEYTDSEDGRTVFAPYVVSLSVDGERESEI
jgi:hypothetical protein